MKETPYDENHPHYFFRETFGKWVRYKEKWYTPEEWIDYHNKNNIDPKVEWYFDILQVLKDAQESLISDPSPDRLRRYFAMSDRVLKYYHHKMTIHSWVKGQGTP